MPEPKTLREAYVQASSFLRGRGIEDGGPCAELLLQHLFGWNRTKLLLHWSEPFPEERLDDWEKLVARKADREPVQYIVGQEQFYGFPFEVNRAVLIPRPETELLVEAVLERGKLLWPSKETSAGAAPAFGSLDDVEDGCTPKARDAKTPTVADIGTGSGAIAVTLALKRPDWRVLAGDLSADALEVARRNAERLGAGERIQFLQGDLLEPLIANSQHVDVLVSNPPYITQADYSTLQPEVRFFEPPLALVGGLDGLDCYRRLIEHMRRLPAMPRLVGFEVGQGQARDVLAMLQAADAWDKHEIVKDLAGIERHVLAYRT